MEKLIKEAYTLFNKYDKLKSLDVCVPCCVSLKDENALYKTPKKLISEQLMNQYNSSPKSGYTIETSNELKYFLPRILELIILEKDICYMATELFLARFKLIPIQAWLPSEIEFLKKFAMHYWNYCLTNKVPFDETLDVILIMLSHMPIDLEILLDKWIKPKTIISFVHFYLDELDTKKEKIINPWANQSLNKLVFAWLNNSKTKTNICNTLKNCYNKAENDTNKLLIDIVYTELNYNYVK